MSNSWMKEAGRFMLRPSSMPGLTEFEPLRHADISAEDIKSMPDSELNRLLAGEAEVDGFVGLGVRQAIMSEQNRRALKRA